MKFIRIRVDRFGPIVGLDTGAGESLPGFVVVLGPNEAGKSAFHHLLSSLIFGFYPATRDQNPFTPWSGGDIEAHADFELDDGARWELHRRLLSSPRGELVRGDRVETLDNRSLPGIDRVDEKIYQQVYAISGAEISHVASEAWDAVRDQLVVGMGSQDLRPPREVIADYHAAADQLWRSTNRGNHRHKALRAEIQEWIGRRVDAEARDRELRKILDRLHVLDQELDGLRGRRTEAAARLETLRELHPFRQRLARYDGLVAELSEVEGLGDLPSDPAARLRELGEAERRRVSEARVTEGIEMQIREIAAALIQDDSEHPMEVPELARIFVPLPVAQMRERMSGLAEERRRLEGLKDQLKSFTDRDTPMPAPLPRWALAAVVMGTGLIIAGAAMAIPLAWIFGVILILGAAPPLLLTWTRRARIEGRIEAQRSAEEEVRHRIPEVEGRVARLTESLHELLEPLPLTEAVSARPTLTLVERLVDLERLLRDWASRSPHEEISRPDELRELEEALRRAGGDTTPDGLRLVMDRQERWHELRRMRADLQRDTGDLEALRSRIREAEAEGEGWDDGPQRRATEGTLLDELDREIHDRRDERSELRERARALAEETTVDVVDGRIQALREELSAVEVERDRRFVRARLLERAESRFRAAHQPDLLRRAEGHLRAITDDRYHRLLMGEGATPRDFQLQADHLPRPTPVEFPLSTGIREQVFFALRLAIVDHLDNGRESLPLLLDEALVNWDPERRARGLDLLLGLSGSRQIFLFTCHPHIADEVARRGGGVVQLNPVNTAREPA